MNVCRDLDIYIQYSALLPYSNNLLKISFVATGEDDEYSRAKRQKYAELRKSTALKESLSNEAIKLAKITLFFLTKITLFEIRTTSWLGFLSISTFELNIECRKRYPKIWENCALCLFRGGGGFF